MNQNIRNVFKLFWQKGLGRRPNASQMIFPYYISTSNIVRGKEEETNLTDLLRSKFPQASNIQVQDISGGCGAMYEVWVESVEFKGLSRVKQHKLITQALEEEIKEMHGLRISTSIPDS